MTDETKQIGEAVTQQADLVRLPLWRSCAEEMLAEGVEYGKTYSAEYFEQKLRCGRDEFKFGLAISEIRHMLETRGFYLSGRGLKGDSFVIIPPSDNLDQLKSYSKIAATAIKRGVILGTNTPLDLLTSEERRRHESFCQKLAMRLIFMRKTGQITKLIQKEAPGLLKISA